jgi:hypothetical protein
MAGEIKKDYDVVGKEAPQVGINYQDYKGVMPRSGEAKMDGGTNTNVPFDTGNYRGKKDFKTLTDE